MESPEPSRFEPPADFGPGAVFVCTAAVPAVCRPSASLSRLVASLPGLHRIPRPPALPDAVGFDESGMCARCDGQKAFSLPWRHVRRLDVGRLEYGLPFWTPPPGRLRLWVVGDATAEGVEPLSAWRRTSEGAVLLCPLGEGGIDRIDVREALRRLAPPGVRVGLGKEPTDRV
ncbi:hypothetical protein ABZY09_16325 [Streptomyces sp. NPDC002928]|uniref:hypothetical protein n=1 Tax=Streptomyces sp. NPDC002928 TaxID=3154440 RepID=UPI0033A1DE6D